jgi:protein gp37
MSQKSSIEWTDATWNPVRGCQKVSPGCKHCYAEAFAERFRGVPGHPYEQGFDLRLVPEALPAPLHWRKPKRIFVNSMSDVFWEKVPDGFIMDMWRIMGLAWQHTFQVLTKRAERLAAWVAKWADTKEDDYEPKLARGPAAVRAAHKAGRAHLFADMIERWGEPPPGAAYPTYDWMEGMARWPTVLPNIHLGVSVEDRKYGLPRIEHLRQVPAAVRFLSVEPLLEDLGDIELTGIHWVIFGFESGNGARLGRLEWIRRALAQCRASGVPAFVKQLGAVWAKETGAFTTRNVAGETQHVRDTKGGDMKNWPADLQVQMFPGQRWEARS